MSRKLTKADRYVLSFFPEFSDDEGYRDFWLSRFWEWRKEMRHLPLKSVINRVLDQYRVFRAK